MTLETTVGDGGLVLVARDLHKSYASPTGPLPVLAGLDLEVRRGTILAIVGASGAGKSTLLNILGTLDHPDRGTIEVGGRRFDSMSANEIAAFRARRLGFIFQFHHLLPEFTAEENVMMPLLLAGENPGSSRGRAREALRSAGLDSRWGHRPAELSGGEAQRVAVARALVGGPELVLADEPSGNLDPTAAQALHALVSSLARERHQTFVIVTHNDKLAALADQVLKLEFGRLVPAC
jgi:lipoprotein-releasing system ATP-binding protein